MSIKVQLIEPYQAWVKKSNSCHIKHYHKIFAKCQHSHLDIFQDVRGGDSIHFYNKIILGKNDTYFLEKGSLEIKLKTSGAWVISL